jgi:hypothetical protein
MKMGVQSFSELSKKKRDALLQLVFNFISAYGKRKIQENQETITFNRTHQILVYAEVVPLFRDNINIVSSGKTANKKYAILSGCKSILLSLLIGLL